MGLPVLSNVRQGRRIINTPSIVNPAAGADWTITVPSDRIWELISVYALLTTDATVANRSPWFTVTDGVRNIARSGASLAHPASTTRTYSAWPGATFSANNDSITYGLPPLIMLPGWTIAAGTFGIVAGDQWSGVVVAVVETQLLGGGDFDPRPPRYIVGDDGRGNP